VSTNGKLAIMFSKEEIFKNTRKKYEIRKNQNLDISSVIDGLKELRSFVLLEKLRFHSKHISSKIK